ncbi:hypothetical protein B0H16DRAFT_1469077 [Mycena metata]|uniref:Uncharacterized protein n=1 Tax=Mycena metata TaxID=1033252 RepID=A0AAD7HYY0_9AGAR|nr:hypothetical protein B0H16DRAFT_1469077 [Mycena metata]
MTDIFGRFRRSLSLEGRGKKQNDLGACREIESRKEDTAVQMTVDRSLTGIISMRSETTAATNSSPLPHALAESNTFPPRVPSAERATPLPRPSTASVPPKPPPLARTRTADPLFQLIPTPTSGTCWTDTPRRRGVPLYQLHLRIRLCRVPFWDAARVDGKAEAPETGAEPSACPRGRVTGCAANGQCLGLGEGKSASRTTGRDVRALLVYCGVPPRGSTLSWRQIDGSTRRVGRRKESWRNNEVKGQRHASHEMKQHTWIPKPSFQIIPHSREKDEDMANSALGIGEWKVRFLGTEEALGKVGRSAIDWGREAVVAKREQIVANPICVGSVPDILFTSRGHYRERLDAWPDFDNAGEQTTKGRGGQSGSEEALVERLEDFVAGGRGQGREEIRLVAVKRLAAPFDVLLLKFGADSRIATQWRN